MSTAATGLKIRYYGDPCLRRRSHPVAQVTERDRALFEEMAEVMRLSGGIGLAAPQVGINRQIVVIDVGQGASVFVNPRILRRRGAASLEEGCLSLPGVHVKVRRAKTVTVAAINELNEKITLTVSDLFARALQHEMDHLRGRLILDHANIFDRVKLRRLLRRQVQRLNYGMSE
jgi:peptide deformylase